MILDDRLCLYRCERVLRTAATDFSFLTTTIQRRSDPATRWLRVVSDHILYNLDHRQLKFQSEHQPVVEALMPPMHSYLQCRHLTVVFRLVDILRGIEGDVVDGSVICSAELE
jgi:hypothetical protein